MVCGDRYPITPAAFGQAAATAGELLGAEVPFRWIEAHRPRLDERVAGILAIDLRRAERADWLDLAEGLRRRWEMVRLALPPRPTMAQLLDVGAYQGGLVHSIRPRIPDLNYLAIDLDPSNAPGDVSVTRMDATQLDLPANSIEQAFLLDICEHLYGYEQVRASIAEAVRVARDFVHIECPDFGDAAYLASLGLKWCWSDWTGHPTAVTEAMFRRAVDDLCIEDIAEVRVAETVYRTDHEQLVRLEAPRDLTIRTDAIDAWRPSQARD